MASVDSYYRFDLTRHLKGAELPPELAQEFQRLVKDLRFGGKFQLLLAEFNNWTIRGNLLEHVAAVMQEVGIASTQLELTDNTYPDVTTLETALTRLAQGHGVIHVLGGEAWFTDARLDAFNLRREAIAQALAVRLVLWLDEPTVRRFAQLAPDWWAWRGGVFSYCVSHQLAAIDPPTPQRGPIDPRSLAKRSRRISELRTFLDAEPHPPDELALPLWDELAYLYYDLGEWDQALRIRTEEELPVYEQLGDVRSKAVSQGKVADILQARGQLDKALRIRTEEELPVYERLGEVREKAVTQIKIADILKKRGQIDEALRILIDESLPVFERLGDVRSKAVTQGRIADIHQARGQLAEALRILTTEVLPVFERLGDVRSKAMILGKIADIHLARGQLDEAMRIHTEEELPVYGRLGDVRSKAITHGKIANILQARGQLAEALRILNDEILPVYERLGDVHSKSVTLFQIAQIEIQQHQSERALEHLATAYQLIEAPHYADGLAAVGKQYGKLLCETGELEKGLKILETARLAALELGKGDSAERIAELIKSFAGFDIQVKP